MTTEKARKLLGYTTVTDQVAARFARSFLDTCTPDCPLRYKVAAKTLIEAVR